MESNNRAQVSEARSRLLETATRIFYAEGLHSVGIERIIAEARVTRATLYRHFPSKDDLVVAYLLGADQGERALVDEALGAGGPAAAILRAIAESIAGAIASAPFRGCAFLNAAAEYPNAEHPVHKAVIAHRQWFLSTVTVLFAQVGEKSAERAARHFVMLRDGAMAAGCLPDPMQVGETFLDAVEKMLEPYAGSTSN